MLRSSLDYNALKYLRISFQITPTSYELQRYLQTVFGLLIQVPNKTRTRNYEMKPYQKRFVENKMLSAEHRTLCVNARCCVKGRKLEVVNFWHKTLYITMVLLTYVVQHCKLRWLCKPML